MKRWLVERGIQPERIIEEGEFPQHNTKLFLQRKADAGMWTVLPRDCSNGLFSPVPFLTARKTRRV